MNILLTGSTGFIGSHLVKALADQHVVYAFIRTIPKEDLPGVKYILYDGTYSSMEKGLAGIQIDGIIHMATHFCAAHNSADLDKLVDANIRLGVHLLEFASKTGVKYFITASTYAQSIDGSDYNPQNLYAATKQAFESLLAYYKDVSETKFIILELTDTYGPGDTRKKFINLAINACQAGETFKMSAGEQEINYLHVNDVVRAIVICLEQLQAGKLKSGDKYSLASGEVYSLSKVADLVWEVAGSKNDIEKGFYPYRKREIMKLKRRYPVLPGWEARITLKEGISGLMAEKQQTG